MRNPCSLVSVLLLQTAISPLILTAVASANVLFIAQEQSQSSEAVAKVAQAITVRIEGATQGSGVLVKREGSSYTVLTAWHVVSGQREGEELEVTTSDGQGHQIKQRSIKKLGDVDLAVLTFNSTNSYKVAEIGEIKRFKMGSRAFVAGFPLPSSSVPTRLLRFLNGDVISNTMVAMPNGYQLLYSNPTLLGMSGGAVLNAQGQLVGIHGIAEKADQVSERSGKAVATGTNQGVPINYYIQYSSSGATLFSSPVREISTLSAWRINADGVLRLRTTTPNVELTAAFDTGKGNQGPRLWIDFPGTPPRPRNIAGAGPIKQVRIGAPQPGGITRLVIEFLPGTKLDPTQLKLMGVDNNNWILQLPNQLGGFIAFGENNVELQ